MRTTAVMVSGLLALLLLPCLAPAAEPSIVQKAVGLHATGADLARPMDIFIEAEVKEESNVKNLGTGKDEVMRASYTVRILRCAAGPCFRFEMDISGRQKAVGQGLKEAQWYAEDCVLQKAAAPQNLTMLAAVYSAVADVCSAVPLARLKPDEGVGPPESVEVDGKKTDFTPVRLPEGSTEVLIMDDGRMLGARFSAGQYGATVLFSGFSREGGLLFPHDLKFLEKGSRRLYATATVKKVAVLREFQEQSYSRQQASVDILTLVRMPAMHQDLKAALERMPEATPEIRQEFDRLIGEARRLDAMPESPEKKKAEEAFLSGIEAFSKKLEEHAKARK